MPKMKTHRGSAKRFKKQVLVNLNVLMRTQVTCSLTNLQSKNVNCVRVQS